MSIQLALDKRTVQGKKLKNLRAAGQIPSVIYGNAEPVLASSAYNVTEKVLTEAGYHSPVMLSIEGQNQLAIVKNVSVDPVSRRILNVEFQAISADEIVEAMTPIRVIDFEASDAAKLHYVVMQAIEEIAIKAKPSDLPEEITVDGSKLSGLDAKITVADLVLPKGVELADKELEGTTVIANVYDPVAEAAARDADDEKATEAAVTEEPKAE